MISIPEFQAVLQDVRNEAKEMKVFQFEVKLHKDHKFHFQAGQFLSLKIEEKVFRAYSFATSPKTLPCFEICAKIIPEGVGSTYLDNLKVDDVITFRGPFGHFALQDAKRDKIFMATGSGIAPIKAFLEELKKETSSGENILIFGNYTADHIAYMNEISEFKNTVPNFDYVFYLSDPEKEDLKKVVAKKGMVTEYIAQKSAEYLQSKDIYLCGSPPMVKDVTRVLTEEKNFTKKHIFMEAYY